MKFLLYGATGYTGRLIAHAVKDYGLTPILAGRNKELLASLSESTGFEYQIISLQDSAKLKHILSEVDVVLHCAGPFGQTSQPMVEACIETTTHYLDITGEISVFEYCAKQHEFAKQANIMLLPGVGFDVVPTDCMSLFLKELLPGANDLKLAFMSDGGISRGSAKTAIDGLGQGGAARRDSKIIDVPEAFDVIDVSFTDNNLQACVSIPWGDVSTAWYTTGIPNITTYMAQPKKAITMMKLSRFLRPLLRVKWVKNFLVSMVDKQPAGPSDQLLKNGHSIVWGQVSNDDKTVEAIIKLPNGYQLTVISALYILNEVLQGEYKAGFQTPAKCFGYQLITDITGEQWQLIK